MSKVRRGRPSWEDTTVAALASLANRASSLMRVLSSLSHRVLCRLISDESLRRHLDYHVPQARQRTQSGDYRQAAFHYRRALTVAKCLGLPLLQGQLMGNLGGVYLELAAYDRARLYSQQAVELAREA